jgi:hypothetical protein
MLAAMKSSLFGPKLYHGKEMRYHNGVRSNDGSYRIEHLYSVYDTSSVRNTCIISQEQARLKRKISQAARRYSSSTTGTSLIFAMMHFRMVNHLLGVFVSYKIAKETAASVLGFLVVLVLDDTVPNVRHYTLK